MSAKGAVPAGRQGSAFGGKKIFFTLAFLILLAGCTDAPAIDDIVPPQWSGDADTGTGITRSTDFNNIRDAVNKNIPVRCDYVSADGELAVAYLQGNNLRIDNEGTLDISGNPSGMKIHTLIKTNKMYVWNEGSDSGLFWDMNAVSEGETSIKGFDQYIAELETKRNDCLYDSAINDELFALPPGVSFGE